MATITSTIKLVDQMTPTLNKISKAIDRVNGQANKLGGARTWNNLNTGITRATKSSHNLYNSLRRIAFTLAALRGLKGLVTISDTMMNATARINNINDGLYTTSEYLDIIYMAAQRSRGSFSQMANSVGKLGTVAADAFGSVNEMIAFTELMNKLFVISGASAAESSNAMYQLTQAMAAGKLQGDEMRSILENAPMLAQKIAKSLGVTTGELKKLGAEGKITADIIKNALFGAADEIEEKFENMPKTIGQTWTEICNHAVNAFRPVIERVQKFINSPTFEKFKNKLFSIITAIANAVIRLFDVFETPRMQNAISKICAALSVLWNIVLDIGTLMVNVATWICDNWSWIGQIVYAVIAAVLLYKAVMLAVSAAVVIANIAQGISAWVAALMAGQAWAWVILIIVALIAIIYAGVAVWNYFTDSAVSATGVLFGCIAFLIACIADLFIFLWDIFMSIIHIVVALAKVIWQVCTNIGQVIKALLTNIVILLSLVLVSILTIIVSIYANIAATFNWLGEYLDVWAANIAIGMYQLTQNLPLYWEYFKACVVAAFWKIVVGGGEALNSLLAGCSKIAKAMVTPFENFANAVIDILNGIIRGWNSMVSSLSITIPGVTIAGKQLWGEQTIKLAGDGFKEIDKVTWSDNWLDPLSINMGGAKANLANALAEKNAASVSPINWSFFDTPEYNVDWSNTGTSLKELWSNVEWMDFGVDFGGIWDDLTTNLDKTWDSSQYKNPVDAFKNWYSKGEALENGVGGLIDGIGALLGGLFGGSGSSGPLGELNRGQGTGSNLPSSLEDLLGGAGGGGLGDTLGSIADNTGSAAGSASNIEDTLDLAEEELELLRKLAEQEVINRFTTAEIHVDMTNNNNVSSNMDLDGIVTHLSNKLYEELGVVASGVHY